MSLKNEARFFTSHSYHPWQSPIRLKRISPRENSVLVRLHIVQCACIVCFVFIFLILSDFSSSSSSSSSPDDRHDECSRYVVSFKTNSKTFYLLLYCKYCCMCLTLVDRHTKLSLCNWESGMVGIMIKEVIKVQSMMKFLHKYLYIFILHLGTTEYVSSIP